MPALTAFPDAPIDAFGGPSARRPSRVLVVCESSRRGAAALRAAAKLTGADTQLSVVAVAPQAVQARCCQRGPSVEVLNCVVRDEAESDLVDARRILGAAADRATFTSLVARRDPPLATWAANQNFDLVVLPARPLAFAGHPFARKLRRATGAELRIVGTRHGMRLSG
jgi:hypothetical protein